MEQIAICIPIPSPVLDRAGTDLAKLGYRIIAQPENGASHLLLPIPSLDPDENIRGGGNPETLLSKFPPDITIIGGMLNCPVMNRYQVLDLLKDENYLWSNASITAHCALKYLLHALPVILPGQDLLIVGWGRIGTCMAELLRALGAVVSVSARKPEDRAMVQAMGFTAVNCTDPDFNPKAYTAVINTVPAPVLDGNRCRADCFLLDLASERGISGDRVLWARGLPAKDAPVSSGALIAQTVHRLIQRKEHDA